VEREKALAREYLGTDGREMHWTLVRTVTASVADTAIAPLQDVLGLGSEARMNLPATSGGRNWRWRFRREDLGDEAASRLRRLAVLFERLAPPA
jgi:4-alpha-glucanotransferase